MVDLGSSYHASQCGSIFSRFVARIICVPNMGLQVIVDMVGVGDVFIMRKLT